MSPYTLIVGVAGVVVEPEIIILPERIVFPSRVLFPTWVVEPVTFKDPVIVTPLVTIKEFRAASEPEIMTFFQFGI
jgi:hypothetical protein